MTPPPPGTNMVADQILGIHRAVDPTPDPGHIRVTNPDMALVSGLDVSMAPFAPRSAWPKSQHHHWTSIRSEVANQIPDIHMVLGDNRSHRNQQKSTQILATVGL